MPVTKIAHEQSGATASSLKEVVTKAEGEINFVVMMISSVIVEGANREENVMAKQKPPKMTTIGPGYTLTEQEVKEDEYLSLSCYWYLQFIKSFAHICKTMKFIELRPASSNPGGPQ